MAINGYEITYVESRNYGITYGDEMKIKVLSGSKKAAERTFNNIHCRAGSHTCRLVKIEKVKENNEPEKIEVMQYSPERNYKGNDINGLIY